MTVTGRVRTDQEIVQDALTKYAQTSGAPSRGDALTALGRLVEARDTAQANRDQWHSAANENAEALAAAEAERDAAIQERDEARRLYDGRGHALSHARRELARLERVEAARQETLEWLRARFASDEANSLKAQADLPAVAEFWRGRAGAFVDAAAWLDDVPDFLAAALSDVTPPHDNGESPVDDPECGTDIGPFAAGAVDE